MNAQHNMTTPAITIIHPTRNRPEQAAKTHNHWVSNAVFPTQIEYLFAVDYDDNTANRINVPASEAKYIMGHNRSAIQAINNAARVSKGRIIVVVSDDFRCEYGWDKILLKFTEGKTDFLLKTYDGYNGSPWLITLPIMDRVYYNRFGYVYQPEYMHMWADTEMTAVGHMLGRVINCDDQLKFIHDHYTTGRTAKDEVNERNDSTWNQGKNLFAMRHEQNFYIQNPVCTFPKSMFGI